MKHLFLSLLCLTLAVVAFAEPRRQLIARDDSEGGDLNDIEVRQCLPAGFPCYLDRFCCSRQCTGVTRWAWFFYRPGKCKSNSSPSTTGAPTTTSRPTTTPRPTKTPRPNTTTIPCLPSYVTTTVSTYKDITTRGSTKRVPGKATKTYTYDPPCAFNRTSSSSSDSTSTKLIHSGCPPVQPMIMTTTMETAGPDGSYTTTMVYTSQPPCAQYPVQNSADPSCSPTCGTSDGESQPTAFSSQPPSSGVSSTFGPIETQCSYATVSGSTAATTVVTQNGTATTVTTLMPYVSTQSNCFTGNFGYTSGTSSTMSVSTTTDDGSSSTTTPCEPSYSYYTQVITSTSTGDETTATITSTATYTAVFDPPCAFGG